MNKASEFHHVADNYHFYQEQFNEILKLCEKNAFLGLYYCTIHKDCLKGAEQIILKRLSEEGFHIRLNSGSEYVELSW